MVVSKRRFRPMSLGDILDEAFDVYKSNFVLLVGIGAVIYVPVLFVLGVCQALLEAELRGSVTNPAPGTVTDLSAMSRILGVYFIVVALLMIAYPIVTGAFTHAISQRYLGEAASIGRSYGFIWRRAGAVVATVLLYAAVVFGPIFIAAVFFGFLSVMVGPDSAGAAVLAVLVVLALSVVALMAYFRLLFSSAALVVEGRKYAAALTRSWQLSSGYGWRVFGIWFLTSLIVGAISAIVSSALVPAIMVITKSSGVAAGAAATGAVYAVIQSLLAPVAAIVVVLLYYDLRIRKEGFDLVMLARDLEAAGAGPAAAPSYGGGVSVSAGSATCAYCQSAIHTALETTICSWCQTAHHSACWVEHGGCATPGCPAAPKPGQTEA